ncbi:MAG TPA: ribokinase [Chitinophagaceae bacterium]|nr:ribokinase [Chitinophagaceae bacterium]
MKNKQILVIGSVNTDLVVKTERLPQPGETVLGGNFFVTGGGKGANQAVAAARLGGHVSLVARIGQDSFGMQSVRAFREEGIDTSAVLVDESFPSGVALITVNQAGENCIVVAPGANAYLTPLDLKGIDPLLEQADILLLQLEIPLETVVYAASRGKQLGKLVILNPAPASALPADLLESLDILTPNQQEAERLTGVPVTDEPSARLAADRLHAEGVATVVVTMGKNGCYVSRNGQGSVVASPQVTAVDTTAAGDVFNGALAVGLSEGMDIQAAASLACRAAALSVTQFGAQTSAPFRHTLDQLFPA